MAVDVERVRAARVAQGLTPTITDPVALRKIAALSPAPAVPVDASSPRGPSASAGAGGSGDLGSVPGASTLSKKRGDRRTHDGPRSEVAG